jgi:predicted O-linked N-acetylglucosamine transferase (SPINDLY family)
MGAGAARLGDETIDAMYAQLALASPSITDRELEARQTAWANTYARAGEIAPFTGVAAQGRPTIGYNGTLWGIQTGQAILNPVMAAHDRTRVRVIGYSHIEQPPSVSRLFDEFHVTGSMSHASFCRLARSHQLDVLVETNGLSFGTRLPAMASRCAPVQVSYVNHAGTCGVPNVDFLITDRATIASIDQRFYTEQLYALDRCFLTYTYRDMWAPPVAPPPVVRNGYVTFGSFGGPYKLNLECLRLWATVLRRVPGSKMLLQNPGMTPGNSAFIRARFESLGIDAGRVTILPGAERDTILANYGLMDISLDSWPYCGGNTTAEAMWQGVPVVTLKGNRFASAYGASLIAAAGIGDLVAHSPEEFTAIAAMLARDPERLTSLRDSLREQMVTFGLSDPKAMATVLEDAYVDMVRRSRSSTGRVRTRTAGD